VEISAEALQKMSRDPDLRERVNVARSSVPAITHVDFSARVQTVDRERNPRLHKVMQRFHSLTGCPVLVNTSFNVRGEPIVCTPEDAYRCFIATEMDALVLEDFVVLKGQKNNGAANDRVRSEYLAQFELD
jgi:carbamoyltransferase